MSSPDVKNDASPKWANNSQRVFLMGRARHAMTGCAARHENTKNYFFFLGGGATLSKNILSGNFCCQVVIHYILCRRSVFSTSGSLGWGVISLNKWLQGFVPQTATNPPETSELSEHWLFKALLMVVSKRWFKIGLEIKFHSPL